MQFLAQDMQVLIKKIYMSGHAQPNVSLAARIYCSFNVVLVS